MNHLLVRPPDRGGDVAGEAPLRVFRYAPASPLRLTRYETKPTTKSLDDPQEASINRLFRKNCG